jgi:hypothetical protein
MALALLSLVLMGCASTAPASGSGYDYGGLRQPTELQPKIEQAQPVVPPQAPIEEPPAKKDRCVPLCALDRECDRLSASCDKMFRETGHMNGATCQQKERVCQRVIANQTAINNCSCE